MTAYSFDFGQYKISAVARISSDSRREYTKSTRVYGAIEALSPELSAELNRWTETPVTEQLERTDPAEAKRITTGYNRARRAVVQDARKKLNTILSALADRLGSELEVKTFSVRAGCSCPCSPGFVLSSHAVLHGQYVDLYIKKI